MLRVGITGGIGSGKSTVCRIFELLHVPVYYADVETKNLYDTNAALRYQLISTFGAHIYNGDKLNRKAMGELVFGNAGELARLNAIVHPMTIAHAAEWMSMQQAPYVLKEAALLFESKSASALDYVIGVSAPFSLRLQRTMLREAMAEDDVKKRMSQQIDEKIKMKLCDFIITNDETMLLIPQVMNLHNQLLQLSEKS